MCLHIGNPPKLNRPRSALDYEVAAVYATSVDCRKLAPRNRIARSALGGKLKDRREAPGPGSGRDGHNRLDFPGVRLIELARDSFYSRTLRTVSLGCDESQE